jgi:hypothetical protein
VGVNFGDPREVQRLQGTMPLGGLIAAVRRARRVVEGMDWAPIRGLEGFRVDLPTPLGRLVVQDAGVQRLGGEGHFLLVLDLGGNDRYEAAVATTRAFTEPVSVLVDLAGNDRYGYAQMDNPPEVVGVPPADGARAGPRGRPGVAFGDAAAGRRHPGRGPALRPGRATTSTCRCGSPRAPRWAGSGCSWTRAAPTTTAASRAVRRLRPSASQRSSTAARTTTCTTACRWCRVSRVIRGVAYLHEAAGAERYTALPGDPLFGGTILYGNPQNPAGSNSSFGRGRGSAGARTRMAPTPPAASACSRTSAATTSTPVDIFGQATGYWFGTGILRDVSGGTSTTAAGTSRGSAPLRDVPLL